MVKTETFGEIQRYTVVNGNISAQFLSFGARMTKIVFNGTDVLLGYDRPEDYLEDTLFIGATVGRFAGRIGNTYLTLGGKQVQLDQNENGTTCHHGGYHAFDKRHWRGVVISDNSVAFSRISENGEGGFPGNLEITVQYTVLENGIEICHRAKTDRETVVNLANHAYFNLSGFDNPDAREQYLSLSSDYYLPLNEKLIPTGEISSVKDTSFDFSAEKKIETDLDHYFIFTKNDEARPCISLYSPVTGIRMNVDTNQPGVQIYTCGAFEADKGKGGIPLHKNQGIALETQGFPDNPNHTAFPDTVLKPTETYFNKTKFTFTVE